MSTMSMIWKAKHAQRHLKHCSSSAHIFMFETVEDLDLPQCPLAVGLVLKRSYLFDGHLLFRRIVQRRAACTVQVYTFECVC